MEESKKRRRDKGGFSRPKKIRKKTVRKLTAEELSGTTHFDDFGSSLPAKFDIKLEDDNMDDIEEPEFAKPLARLKRPSSTGTSQLRYSNIDTPFNAKTRPMPNVNVNNSLTEQQNISSLNLPASSFLTPPPGDRMYRSDDDGNRISGIKTTTMDEQPNEPLDDVRNSVLKGRPSFAYSEYSVMSTYTDYQKMGKNRRMKLILVFVLWLTVFVIMYLLTIPKNDPRIPKGNLGYCDTHKTDQSIEIGDSHTQCLKCPDKGQCKDGMLIKCDAGYEIKMAICENEENRFALKMVKLLQQSTQRMKGKVECGGGGKNFITRSTFKHTILYEEFMDQYDDLTNEEVEKDFESAYKMWWRIIEQNRENFQLELENVKSFKKNKGLDVKISSTKPKFSKLCKLMIVFRDHRILLASCVAICVAVYLLNLWHQKNQERTFLIQDVASITITRLSKKPGNFCIVREMRNEMASILFEEKIDIFKVWDEVEDLIDQDKRISSDKDETGAKVWYWRSTIDEDFQRESPEVRKRSLLPQTPPNY